MSNPLRYEDLTAQERKWMCNGCGPHGGPDVPDFVFYEACCRHDFDYWLGYTSADRDAADQRFLNSMLAAASMQSSWWLRTWYKFLAWRYYSAVRWLGSSKFENRGRYGTREDLAADMINDPR